MPSCVFITFLVSISHGFTNLFLLETLTVVSIFMFCQSVLCNFIFILGTLFKFVWFRLYESLYEYSFTEGKFIFMLVNSLIDLPKPHWLIFKIHLFTVIVLDISSQVVPATIHCTPISIWLLLAAFSSTFKIKLDLLKLENVICFHIEDSYERVPSDVDIWNFPSNICHTLFQNLSVHLITIGNLDHCNAVVHCVSISKLFTFQGIISKVRVLVTHCAISVVPGKHI